MPNYIATCAKGLEYTLKDELLALGVNEAKEGLSLVHFDADWKTLYTVLMWSRIASRILYPIATFSAEDENALYQQVSIIDWTQHIAPNATLLVNSQSYRSKLSHTQFISQRVKDAIVDRLTEEGFERPEVQFIEPDVVIHCKIRRNQVTLSIDFAGVGMHQRGYRVEGGAAPIKENLAAALLTRAGWSKKQLTIYDPMCGSGTFLIEAAMIAADIAPGLLRDYLGIVGWRQFDHELWKSVVQDAQSRREAGIENAEHLSITGSDKNPRAVRNAQMNVSLAGLDNIVKIKIAAIDQIEDLSLKPKGLVIVNPPYSERLGEREEVIRLYKQLGDLFKRSFNGWKASVLSADKQFGHALGIRAKKIYKFNNGSIACELLNLELETKNFIQQADDTQPDENFKEKLTEQASYLANRLEKNIQKLKKYLKQNQVTCYRLYDADLPEYNAAIDVYDKYVHIQEYRAPKSVDEKTASRRLNEIKRVTAGVLGIPLKNVFVKQRRQQKGDWQYSKGSNNQGVNEERFFKVTENGRKFWVNLQEYLDTGLFLDHRKTREIIGSQSKGKTLLNLFCYTASISVYAASAGAKSVTSVDMSNTYLDWAKRNFALNGLSLEQHSFIRDDVTAWLDQAIKENVKFDLIFLDPPTFSNSKKMDHHFDVQSDHADLIERCIELLTPQGKLYFSNNFQKFTMDYTSNERVNVREITAQTTPPDFQRKPLHKAWLIQLNGK